MKNCVEQAIDILKDNNLSIADALSFLPHPLKVEASIIAAAFFSSDFRVGCIQQVPITMEQQQAWFHPSSTKYRNIETIEELKIFFKESSASISQAMNYLFNKASSPQITSFIDDVLVAIAITHWINQLGQTPESFILLPQALIEEFNLDIEAVILAKRVPEAVARALSVLMGEARQSFVRFYNQLDRFEPDLLLAIYTGVKFQEALLDEIIWAKFELFSSAQEVSSLRRAFMSFKAKRFVRRIR